MSDAEKPQSSKPSRLSGLVALKGAAVRPGEPPPPAPIEVALPPTTPKAVPDVTLAREQPVVSSPSAPPMMGTGSKSLTLRLSDSEYERLRAHAFTTRRSHQAILAEALKRFLDADTY